MTRKDFELIASVLWEHRQRLERHIMGRPTDNESYIRPCRLTFFGKLETRRQFEALVTDFVNALHATNPQFDAERFRQRTVSKPITKG